ncbi:MAG: hypothetical protein LUF30_04430 [Lachnospiraceae bacterium]|nr:hypothetical protein [Lachnospiraceae bacterium]
MRKAADAELYKRTKQAEAELFEQKKQAEAARYAKEQEAAGVLALAEAEAEAVRKKGLAEAEAMEKKAEAYKQYGQAALTELSAKLPPAGAAQGAAPLSQIDRITIYGGDGGSGVNGVADNVPTVLAKTFDTVKAATGIDLAEIVRSESYDAKVNRNLNISGSLEGKSGIEPGMTATLEDTAEAAAEAAVSAETTTTA